MRAFAALLMLIGLAARAEAPALVHAATLYRDAKDAPLLKPAGVACTEDGKLVVADTGNGRLLVLSFKDGRFSSPVEVKPPQLGKPVRVQITAKGDVLALDSRGRRIVRVGLQGDVRGYVEPSGVPGARAVVPAAFRVDRDDRLIILDAAAARVVVLGADGAFQRSVKLPDGSFLDVAVDGRGTLYAVEGSTRAVYAADKGAKAFSPFSRKLGDYASFPAYAAVTDRNTLVVVDSHGGGLALLGADGAFLGRQLGLGWAEGSLYYPGQICLDGRGHVFVADRNNDRVQAFATR